jgi:hypothetical protein
MHEQYSKTIKGESVLISKMGPYLIYLQSTSETPIVKSLLKIIG